jgi:hypothetical protein
MRLRVVSVCLYFALVCAGEASPTAIDSATFSNPTDSLVLGDDSDSSRLWVLPPTTGMVTGTTPQPSVTLPICRSLASTSKSIEQISEQQDTIRQEQYNILHAIDDTDPKAIDKINVLTAKYNALTALLVTGEKQIDDFKSKYGIQDGGFAHILYETNWDHNVAAIKTANQSMNVSPIETKQLKMYFAIPGSDHGKFDLTGIPVFKAYTVQGVTYDLLTKETDLVMSDKLGVDLQLSTWGGCFIAFPELFGQDVSPKFALSTSFLYPRSYRFHVKATYNIWQIYKYFQESGRRNDLLNASTYSSTLEQNWGDSAFKPIFYSLSEGT